MNSYPVFLDTEFTDWSNPKLISLGLVDHSGNRTFYAELTDTYDVGHVQHLRTCRGAAVPLWR